MEMKPNFGTRRLREDGHWSVRGLVGYWAMSEGSGGIVHDLTRNDNDGTMTNMVPEQDWVAGDRGWATEYDGGAPAEYIDCGDGEFFTGLSEVSVVVRVRTDFVPTYGSSTFILDHWTRPRFLFNAAVDDFRWQIATTSGTVNCDTQSLSWASGEWHQVAGTYDGAQQHIWWDGLLNNSENQTGTIPTQADNLTIGASSRVSSPWLGLIDFVAIYNRALLTDEIEKLHDFPNIVYAPRFPAYLFAGAVIPPTPGIAVEYDVLNFTRTRDVLDLSRDRDVLDLTREYDVLDFERP